MSESSTAQGTEKDLDVTSALWRERVSAHLATLGTHLGSGTRTGDLQMSTVLEPDGAVATTCAIADAVQPVVALWASMDDDDVTDSEYSLALLDRNGRWHQFHLAAANELDEDFYDLADDDAGITVTDDQLERLVSTAVAEVASQVDARSFHDRWTLEQRMIKHLSSAAEQAPDEVRVAFDRRHRAVTEIARERIKIAVEDLHIKEIRERASQYAQEMLDEDPSLLTATKPHRRGVVNRRMKLKDSYCVTVDAADVVVVALDALIVRQGSGQSLF